MGTYLLLALLAMLFLRSGWLMASLWLMLGMGVAHRNLDTEIAPIGYVGAFVVTIIVKTLWGLFFGGATADRRATRLQPSRRTTG